MIPDEVNTMANAWAKWQGDRSFPFSADHCINGTRVAVTALGQLGVKARPVSVQFMLMNKPAFELYSNGVSLEKWPEHAHSIGVGPGATKPGAEPDKWNGHLVCEGEGFTLDISAMQVHRPGKIVIPSPFVMPPLPAEGRLALVDDVRQVLWIGRWPENNAWRQAGGWMRPQTAEAAELVRRTRIEMKGTADD